MRDLSTRSYQKEILDGEDTPFEDIKRNMYELDVINTWLGGHRITIKGLQQLLKERSYPQTLNICEIGCGGGDNLRVIKHYCNKRNIKTTLTGIDINPYCIDYAQSRKENEGIQFICSDYSETRFTKTPDIIFSSLFCHHFTEKELQFQFEWMKKNSAIGFFVNDLHRHAVAYNSIKVLTKLFSKSYLVKNDAPLSVARGFKRNEFIQICSSSSISDYRLKWMWGFRWLLIVKHER